MRCKICNKECVNEEMNICSGCSTSGIEYKQKPMKRISFDEYDMEHLYSMAIDNFEDNCVECQQLKKRIEKFLGEETMKEIMKSKRNKK